MFAAGVNPEPHFPSYLYAWPGPYIYSVYTVFLAGKLRDIRSYTVYINGSGQPYFTCFVACV